MKPYSKVLTILFAMLAGMSLLATRLSAQSTFANLTGTVRDTSGGVVPHANVSLTEVNTNIVQNTSTDGQGNYEFLNLLPGHYVVAVKLTGFQEFKTTVFELVARQEQRADATLTPAAQATQVQVVSAAPLINTEDAAISDATRNLDLVNAPFNFRTINTSPLAALYIMPEAVKGGGADGRAATPFDIQGASAAMSDVTVDGTWDGSTRRNGVDFNPFPSTDSISELRIDSVGNAAEYSRVADVLFVTKGGTNQLHGAAFYNYNGNSLNANPNVFFNSTNVQLPSRSVNNDYGVSVGGPIRRNKTFFFGTFEGLKVHQYAGVSTQVFQSAWRTGDFSSLLQGSNPIQLMDPFTGQPYLNNHITEPINSVTNALFTKFIPPPNSGVDRYIFSQPITSDSNQYDIRIDQNITERQRLFGRWSDKYFTPTTSTMLPGLGIGNVVNRPKNLVVSYNFAVKANLLNEFRFGWMQSNQLVNQIGIDEATARADLGLNLPATSFPPGSGFPHFYFGGVAQDISGFNREDPVKSRNMEWGDNLTWTRGRHTMKFGAVVHRFGVNEQSTFNGADNLGQYTFSNFIPSAQNPSVNAGTGYAGANFYLGLPVYNELDSAGPDYQGEAYHYGFFGQDSWKASRRLTINFGLRWEYNGPFTEKYGNMTNFDRATGNAICPNAPGAPDTCQSPAAQQFLLSLNGAKLLTASQAGWPETLRWGYYKDYNPRFGFAWLPFANSTRTVIRGGYGIYSMQELGPVLNSLTGIHTAAEIDYNLDIDTSVTPHVPAAVWPNTTTSLPSYAPIPLQGFSTANDPHLKDPYTEQWSLTVEHQFTNTTSLRATYTGQHAMKLIYNPNLNQIPFNTEGYGALGPPGGLAGPNFCKNPDGSPMPAGACRPYESWDYLSSRDNGGTLQYQDFTLQVKRNTHGMMLSSTYILAHAMTNMEGPGGNENFTTEAGNRPSSWFNLWLDWGHQAEIPTQRWVTDFDLTSPFGKGEAWGNKVPSAGQAVLGGWQFFSIITLTTGHHQSGYTEWNTEGVESPQMNRPDLVSGQDINNGPHTDADWLNKAAFTSAAFHTGSNVNYLGRMGNSPVGVMVGPGMYDLDLGLRRNFKLNERFTLAFLVQAKNLFNYADLGDVDTNVDDPTNYGKIFGLRGDGPGMRTINLGMRLEF